jgi:hypothetical protein
MVRAGLALLQEPIQEIEAVLSGFALKEAAAPFRKIARAENLSTAGFRSHKVNP